MNKLAGELSVHALTPKSTRGILTCGALTVPCALGRTGRTARKSEGDGATPLGRFELMSVLYRPDRGLRPKTVLPVTPLAATDGWCDDPAHPHYNQPVDLPFAAGHEVLWREDRLYDIVVLLNQNMFPAVPGRGSAIFFHIAREGYSPTEGCVAVAPSHMRAILERVQPGAHINIR
ncbi:L,D-transpeptidase family protein [Roseibium limicola]|uniref:L,D-transpeptidase family protein n=1 Tax=Roseibium limicola TaxID=2816037 RepID=UPI001E4F417E|nr:L,D-transpeptidase family protein [Roseibium limicola]